MLIRSARKGPGVVGVCFYFPMYPPEIASEKRVRIKKLVAANVSGGNKTKVRRYFRQISNPTSLVLSFTAETLDSPR